jgi:hypothetical protein
MSFCPSRSSIQQSRQNSQDQSSCCKLPFSSFPNQQYQSNQLCSTINHPKQQLFSSTHVSCQPTSTLNNTAGSNTTSTPSLTYRLINALSSIYKPFSQSIPFKTNKSHDKCLPLLNELVQDMINQYTITIDELEYEIDYLSNKIPKYSC